MRARSVAAPQSAVALRGNQAWRVRLSSLNAGSRQSSTAAKLAISWNILAERFLRRPEGAHSITIRMALFGSEGYALPLIVALLSVRGDDLVMIENPEAHLHPGGQTRVAELAARAAATGAQVVLETHSDHVLAGYASRSATPSFRRAAGVRFAGRGGELFLVCLRW